jgi:hypothetical protein
LPEPLDIPDLILPIPPDIPVPALELPKIEYPEYPQVLFPSELLPGVVGQEDSSQEEETEEDPESSEKEQQDKNQESPIRLEGIQQYTRQNPALDTLNGWPWEQEIEPSVPEEATEGIVTVVVAGFTVPLPEPQILVAAGATATTSVAATLASTALIKRLSGVMKPIIKKVIARLRRRPVDQLTWARQRLVQRRSR